MKKVLITGVAGFIGFHMAKTLAARGCDVAGVDNLNDYYPPALKRARLDALDGAVKFAELDIADADSFAAFVKSERPEVVLHLAAQAGVRYSLDHPFAYAHSNLLGHLSVLEACRHADSLSHLVYASSSSVYGGATKVPFSEDDRVDNPVSLYAATKRSGELMSATYAHLYGLKQIGLRFFTVYGPWGRPDMAYWLFTDAILKGEPIRVFNHGDMSRDFTYIDDAVTAVTAITETPPSFSTGERPHRLYNIGNHAPVPLMDMIAALENLLGRKAEKIMELMQPGDVKETYADVSAAQADYGFNPSTSINEGLRRFVEWRRSYRDV
ncbi:MAG: NAD-dependent epimerase/dehydratase family protein [Parvularculaceae bacterium]